MSLHFIKVLLDLLLWVELLLKEFLDEIYLKTILFTNLETYHLPSLKALS